MYSKLFFIILILAVFFNEGFTQNLDKIGSKDRVKVSGGFNFNSIFYNAQGIANRRSPFTWFASGNVTVNILDVSLPFTYSYSNNQSSYTQPFNQVQLAPQYKWIKAYVGYTSMNFSSYTLAGHLFSGVGLELTPGKWRISGMYGKLVKAVPYDVLNKSDNNMAYERWGKGLKIGYESGQKSISLIYFDATDVASSLSFVPISSKIYPQQNTAVALKAKTNVGKKMFAELEYSLSLLNRNSNQDISNNRMTTSLLFNTINITSNQNSYDAFKASYGYQFQQFKISLNYERVAPDYKTLGGYFFNNDMQNITIAPQCNLLKNKIAIAGNIGVQNNNLAKNKINPYQRVVSAINLNYVPNKSFNTSFAYSNFQNTTKMRLQQEPYSQNFIDTLSFYQVTQSINFSGGYNWGTQVMKHSITINTSQQQVVAQTTGNGLISTNNTNVATLNSGYTLNIVSNKIAIGTFVNYTQSRVSPTSKQEFYGPNISLSKNFKQPVRLSLTSTYNIKQDLSGKGNIFNNRLSISYTPKTSLKIAKPSFSISGNYLQSNQRPKSFAEFTGLFNISLGF